MVATALAVTATASRAQSTPEPVVVKAVAHFDFDQAILREADREAILAEVGRMKGVTWQRVIATGHTDSIGPVEYNDDLSRRRAQSVREYLLSHGLSGEMVASAAQGESAPVADNTTTAGRAQNRRTEIEFRGVRASKP